MRIKLIAQKYCIKGSELAPESSPWSHPERLRKTKILKKRGSKVAEKVKVEKEQRE